MKKILKIFFLLLTVCAMIYFAYKICIYVIEEQENQKFNKDLFNTITIQNSNEDGNLPILIDFQKLKQENEDIVGWIYSENTPINYPIAKASDNNYYLRKLLNGEYNTAGTIFMNYRNSSDYTDFNTIIYGHNMKNDSMFGTLPNYKEQSYYDNHKEMYLFTENKNYKIELFAGYTTPKDSSVYNLQKNADLEFVQESKNKSSFKSDVDVKEDDKIITFSTCEYDYDGERYILLGVLSALSD